MLNRKFIPWAIVGILVVLLILLLVRDSRVAPTIIETQHTDTLTVVKHDTIEVTKVVTVVEKEPSDTVYLTVRDSIFVPVPRQEYTFSEPDLFDFRVKGFGVEFLDAKVYPKTIYQTITNTVETTVYKDAWNCYLGVGIWAFDREIVPTVNLTIKTPNRWLFGLNIGYYNKRPIYGGSVNYKILGK